jgi:hypothetical protein
MLEFRGSKERGDPILKGRPRGARPAGRTQAGEPIVRPQPDGMLSCNGAAAHVNGPRRTPAAGTGWAFADA